MKKLSKLSLLLTALFTLSLASVPVYALGAAGTPAAANAQSSANAQGREHSAVAASPDANAATNASANATAAKQKACTRREKNVGIILGRIADRGQRQIGLFGTIASRVENFATTNNKQPADYQTLVDAVNTAHDNAAAAVSGIKTESTNVDLKCAGTSTDTKGAVATLQAALKSEISALEAYRTSVKNLIVGVKSVTGTTNSSSSTGGSH